jgi:hypothetical protein
MEELHKPMVRTLPVVGTWQEQGRRSNVTGIVETWHAAGTIPRC